MILKKKKNHRQTCINPKSFVDDAPPGTTYTPRRIKHRGGWMRLPSWGASVRFYSVGDHYGQGRGRLAMTDRGRGILMDDVGRERRR